MIDVLRRRVVIAADVHPDVEAVSEHVEVLRVRIEAPLDGRDRHLEVDAAGAEVGGDRQEGLSIDCLQRELLLEVLHAGELAAHHEAVARVTGERLEIA